MVSKLENARINGEMQSSLTQTNSELPIQRERPLQGHHLCLSSIALPIELAQRVGFRVTADAMQILFDMLNIASLLTWSMMVLYQLKTHGSDSRIGISVERMEAKLGWLREYAEDLRRWNQCQDVIDRSVWVINRQGQHARTEELIDQSQSEQNSNWRKENSSTTRIGLKLIDWVEQSSSNLQAGERTWLSTEILESLFGRFKQMERQHSNGGLTRLIAALPTLCLRVNPGTGRKGFLRVDCKATQKWITDSLGHTLTDRRNAAYREAKTANHEFQISNAVSSGQG